MILSTVSKSAHRGQHFNILTLHGSHLLCERLHEMGLRPGLELEFWGRAPFKGPWLYRFQNTLLALREEEASCLHVY
jgi:Fe2+ transport system protein FeoA